MKDQLTVSGYSITTDPRFQDERFGITPELAKQMETLYFESQDKEDRWIIKKLIDLIGTYPKAPQLKNYLSVAYGIRSKSDKAKEVNNWILTEHPDYLFGKINRANEYINEREYYKVPQVLGEAMEIKELYPERELFHLSEVTCFYKLAIRYYVAIDNLELAENRMEVLHDIAPDHPDTESAQMFLMSARMEKGLERWEQENKQRITPVNRRPLPLSNTKTAPLFNHHEIYILYSVGLRIPPEELKKIIDLPRTSLIEDLEKMLADGVERFRYFSGMDWEEETHNFILHSIFLLKEINAQEGLPKIISFLGYEYDFLEFWLGDHLTESLWLCLYQLGFNNTEPLRKMLMEPGVDTYVKTSASEALCQMVLHHPEKRKEILQIFSEIFAFFSHSTLEDNIIDSDFLGLAIGDTLDCKFSELLPVIKILYEKGYVSVGIVGGYEEVEKEFSNFLRHDKKMPIRSIYDLYENVLDTWAGYQEEEEEEDGEEEYADYRTITAPKTGAKKVGRNDPCPCGSGKKYKKCCDGRA